jgi:hypothetical protein
MLRRASMEAVELEVLSQNRRAVKFQMRHGFKPRHGLF